MSENPVERRSTDSMVVSIMGEVRQIFSEHEKHEAGTFKGMRDEIRQNNTDSNTRHTQLLERFETMQKDTNRVLESTNTTVGEIHKMFKAAFPDGDFDSHRKAHEYLMAKDKEDKEFWLKVKQDVVKWVFTAAIGWGGIVIWAAFLKGPGA